MSDEQIRVCEQVCGQFDGEPANAATFAKMVSAVAAKLANFSYDFGDAFSSAPKRSEFDALVYVTGYWFERNSR